MKNPFAAMPTSIRWAWLGYGVSRFFFFVCFSALASDVEVYFKYALAGVDRGLLPYREITKLEYPPVAYWVMCLPRHLMSEHFSEAVVPEQVWIDHLLEYDILFRGLMTLCDIGAFCCFVAIVKRRRPERLAWCMWGYTLSTSAIGYVLLERLDVGLTFTLMAWAYCGLRADDEREPNRDAWSVASYAALGLGISYKLIPILLAPFALLVDGARLVRGERSPRWWLGPTMFLVTSLGPYLYYYAVVGNDLGRMFEFHADRGVEIEATYSTAMMLTAKPTDLRPYYDYGSWNLGGAWELPLARAGTPLLVGVLAVLGLTCLVQAWRGRDYDRTAAYLAATIVIPVAVALSKVFSVQYLCWALPLLMLAAAEFCSSRAFKTIVVLSIISAALTGFIYPYHFVDGMKLYPYSKESPPPWTLVELTWYDKVNDVQMLFGNLNDYGPPWWAMNVRNVFYVGCVVTVVIGWWRFKRHSSLS